LSNEIGIVSFLEHHRWIAGDPVLLFLTRYVSVITVFFVLWLIWLIRVKNRRNLKPVLYRMLLSLLMAAVFGNIIKFLIQRPRPYRISPEIIKLTSGGGYSFPSGHTTEVFVLLFALWPFFRNKFLRLFLLVWALLIAYTRMAFGVHYPSDIIGGIVLAYTYVYLSERIIKKYVYEN